MAYFLLDTVVPPQRATADPQAGQAEAMQVLRQFTQSIYPLLTAN